jgi:hypothetical protein
MYIASGQRESATNRLGEHGGMGFGPMRQTCKVLHEPPDCGRHFFFRTPDARSLEGDTRMHSPQDDCVSIPTSHPDVLVNNVGTLYTFCPLTLRAKEWIDEHVQDDAEWFGHALVVEHGYAWGLAKGMKDAGLVLSWTAMFLWRN